MRYISIFLSCLLIGLFSLCKSFGQNNHIGIELLGNATSASLFYERTIFKKRKIEFRTLIGGSSIKYYDFNKKLNPDIDITLLPILNYYVHPKHALLLGPGLIWSSYIIANKDKEVQRSNDILFTLNIGYEYYWHKKWSSKFFLAIRPNDAYILWPGITLQYRW